MAWRPPPTCRPRRGSAGPEEARIYARPVATVPPVEPRPDGADRADRPWIEPAGAAAPMPRWVLRAVVVFWLGFIATLVGRWLFSRLHTLLFLLAISLFLSFAIEPGVNFLARRGWPDRLVVEDFAPPASSPVVNLRTAG